MKKQTPVLITALSLAVAIGSISFGVSASHRKKAAEEEANRLRMQIARMQAFVPEPDTTEPAILRAASVDTNSLAELAALRAELATAKKTEQPQRESREDRMARMKAEDPEGYAEMIRRREEFQEKMKYNLAERTATFMDLDTSNMSRKEQENHELLVEKMAAIWAMTDQFNDPEQPPDRDAMRELFAATREVRPLLEQERTTMFKQLGSELGYEGRDAKDFANHIDDIISATSIQMPRGGGRGGGGR